MRNDPHEVGFDNALTFLEEEARETIRPRCLVARHVVDRFKNLTLGHWSAKAMQIKWFQIKLLPIEIFATSGASLHDLGEVLVD